MLSRINVIRSQDFRLAWIDALGFVLERGVPLTFGDRNNEKIALDSCQLIELTGDAIGQIERREVHPEFPFGGKRLDAYCREFEREYLRKYNKRNEEARFDYLYFDRLAAYQGGIDQLQVMRGKLYWQCLDKIASNHCQAITWIPEVDNGKLSNPCLQRISVRYIGNHSVDVRYEFRSRDLWGAWCANIVALTEMLNREVIMPNKCTIARIIDFSDSLHVYETDLDAVKKIAMTPMVRNH